MSYADYHARCWATGRTTQEINAEIAELEKPRDYAWNEVGNATLRYGRIDALREILTERAEASK